MKHKISINDLVRYRKEIERKDKLAGGWRHSISTHAFLGMPVDWEEFRNIYLSARPVVVECPENVWIRGESMMELFAALRSAVDLRKVGLYSWYDWGIVNDNCYFDSIILNKNRYKASKPRQWHEDDDLNIPASADDWMFKSHAQDLTWLGPKQTIEYVVNETDGFRKWIEADSNKRVLILWASEKKDGYNKLKETYGNRFMFVDYTKDKKFADEWFAAHKRDDSPLVDPVFDIRLMDPGLNRTKVLAYLATNHPREFKEYASLNVEAIPKYVMEMAG